MNIHKRYLILTTMILVFTGIMVFCFSGTKIQQELGEKSLAFTHEILAFGPRPPGSENLKKVQNHISSTLQQSGWELQEQAFQSPTPLGTISFKNLRFRFKNHSQEQPFKRPIQGLLCAHLDSKYDPENKFLGADDAASACAALVIIAQELSRKHPQKAAQIELVFFDGEEALERNMTLKDGLYGSRYYANQWRNNPQKPHWGVLLDMIGHENLTIRLPSDSPEFLKTIVLAKARDLGVEKHFGMANSTILDDHVPLNNVGIPTIDIIGDFPNKHWWHEHSDNATILSPSSLSISISVTLDTIFHLLDNPTAP